MFYLLEIEFSNFLASLGHSNYHHWYVYHFYLCLCWGIPRGFHNRGIAVESGCSQCYSLVLDFFVAPGCGANYRITPHGTIRFFEWRESTLHDGSWWTGTCGRCCCCSTCGPRRGHSLTERDASRGGFP